MRTRLPIALRTLARRPAFTLAAIATLGVGIGATTSIFGTVNATLLRPLPFSQPGDLYTLRTAYVDGRFTNGRVAGAYLTAIAESAETVERAVAAVQTDVVISADEGRYRHVLAHTVEAGFFDLFGLTLAAGHVPGPDDGGMAVLSYRLWDEMFGRDPEIVGRVLRLATGTATIAGVASAEFEVPAQTDVWFTGLRVQPTGTGHNYEVYLRSRPGVAPDRLRTELALIMSHMGELYPATASGRRFIVTPIIDEIVGDLRPILLILLAGAVMLLVLACVNVAMLISARGAGQTKELAVRAALGAGRSHIVRLFLTESFALAFAGTIVGAVLALACVKLLLVLGASELPRLESVPIDGHVLLFVIGTLVGSAALVGLAPAMRMANPNLRSLLGESGWSTTGGRATRRLLSGLVVTEITLATTLVIGAGWLVQSYVNLAGTDPGFDPRGRLFFDAQLLGSSFAPQPVLTQLPDGSVRAELPADAGTPALWLAELTERLTVSDQITAVGAASSMPLHLDWDGSGYIGVPGEYDEQRQDNARWRYVSPGFFEAMGIGLIEGRTFASQESGRVVIVNEEFVRRHFPDRDIVVGATFAYGFPMPDFDNPLTILGVVEDVKYGSLAEPPEPILYEPRPVSRQSVVIATTLADPTPLIPQIRNVARAIDPSIPVTIESVQSILSAATLRHRLGLVLMASFGVLALALAAVGIYGVIAHVTGERSREIATRMAFGATPSVIVRFLMREGVVLASVGLVIGIVVALAGGRVIANRLYDVRTADPVVLIAAAAAVLVVALLAFLLPALRAAHIRPSESLRCE